MLSPEGVWPWMSTFRWDRGPYLVDYERRTPDSKAGQKLTGARCVRRTAGNVRAWYLMDGRLRVKGRVETLERMQHCYACLFLPIFLSSCRRLHSNKSPPLESAHTQPTHEQKHCWIMDAPVPMPGPGVTVDASCSSMFRKPYPPWLARLSISFLTSSAFPLNLRTRVCA